ncbi:hypothetical protein DPMN_168193 [Dreissena polymorpha]|uniref:Uncharacterized protein n=1 Tax=Dreissena polymorpha TaxID=45954 RepID=A0A9D4F069_DREPO|nr:hypothetical protein DPMN_168193 [Dreissena polymorpha]
MTCREVKQAKPFCLSKVQSVMSLQASSAMPMLFLRKGDHNLIMFGYVKQLLPKVLMLAHISMKKPALNLSHLLQMQRQTKQ